MKHTVIRNRVVALRKRKALSGMDTGQNLKKTPLAISIFMLSMFDLAPGFSETSDIRLRLSGADG
ncbi:MAG: hypothetical protein PHR16_18075 [Methylovulum sp.]|nr:hypothetical protein [Methylovulum sp.]